VTADGFFFAARTGATGRELWYYDGSSVIQMGDPDPGVRSGVASDRILLLGDKVFFAGSDDDGNSEPWAVPFTPTLSIKDLSVSESSGTATLTVRLMPPNPTATVTVDWSTVNDSTTNGSDFTPNAGTLTFAPKIDSQDIAISIAADTTTENDESLNVVLSNAATAEIANSFVTVTIHDDDGFVLSVLFIPPPTPPTPPFSVLKKKYSTRFDVTLTGNPHAQPISVDYRTIAVTTKNGIVPPVPDFTKKTSVTAGAHTIVHTPLMFPPTPSSLPQTVTIPKKMLTMNDQTHENR
jgi:ELWxxDGT repeat protein